MCTYWYALQKDFIFLFQKSKSIDSCTHPTAPMRTRNPVDREFLVAAFTQLTLNSPFWQRLENVQFPACIKLLKSPGQCWQIKWWYQPFAIDGEIKTWRMAKPMALNHCALPKTDLPYPTHLPYRWLRGSAARHPQTNSQSYSFLSHEDIFQCRKPKPLASQITVKQTTPYSSPPHSTGSLWQPHFPRKV